MQSPSSRPLDLLLDTHVLLWWLDASSRLSKRGKQAVLGADRVYASVASIWELSLKMARGTLQIEGDLEAKIRETGFEVLPVTMLHAMASIKLPQHHRDPFDRMLVAQAVTESLTLLTADSTQSKYGVAVMLL
jgi:PIN domain nuclease of toxin-antitoxin system